MSTASAKQTDDLSADLGRSIVLTSNERLRRHLIRDYNDRMRRAGRRAWAAPRVFSIDGWLAQTYQLARGQHPGLPRLLEPGAELLLWRSTAPEDQQSLAPLARDAWRLCWQWSLLSLQSEGADATPRTLLEVLEAAGFLRATENGRLFHDWALRFANRLAGVAAGTRAEISARLCSLTPPAADRITCFALESPPTALTRYLERLRSAGWEIGYQEAREAVAPSGVRTAFPDPGQELSAAAQWCRQILLDDPEARIGVVVPDLAQRYQAVNRQFGAWLEPPGSFGTSRLYDIAGGTPLGQQPVWLDAERWLHFCLGGLPVAQVTQLLDSPYLELPEVPQLPSVLRESFGVAELARVSDEPFWRGILRALPNPSRPQALSAWLEAFETLLELGGWTGRGAESGQFQAYEQLQTLLGRARLAAAHEGPCSAADALSALRQQAWEDLFAPERPAAPVQVLGYLETTGLSFSHLWVSGMQDTDWPQSISPNPLVPLSAQLRHDVPRVSPDSELNFAERRVRQWQGAARTLIFSHACSVDGVDHQCSPLLELLPDHAPETLVEHLQPVSHPALMPRPVRLERRPMASGTTVPAGAVRGGSNLLRDQALCPFRAWAIHRLGLESPRGPHAFPDALDRGLLLHTLMQLLLDRGDEPPAHPLNLDASTLDAAVERALDLGYRRFPRAYVERERARLAELLDGWLQLERDRPPYQVRALEQEVQLEVAGLKLRLRLDRVDQVQEAADDRDATETLLVLDYKTGRVNPARMLDERLLEPQLPLYAMANPSVQGVLYVELSNGQPRAAGLGAEHVDLRPARSQALPDGDWEALRRRWRGQLTALGEAFRNGHAAAAPAGPEACRYCHLQRFCRIGEGEAPLPGIGESPEEES